VKRSGTLARRTPLARTASAPKHTRTARPKPHRSAGIPPQVRAALKARSGGECEIRAPGCDIRATEASHRKPTGMGGRRGTAAVRHHVLSNLLHACSGCHHVHVHGYPGHAYWQGWALRENDDPTVMPVLYRGCWSLLANDGTVTRTDKTTADVAEEA
jgi:hypothetical protein